MRFTLPLLLLTAACRPAEPAPVRVVIVVIDGVRLDESFAPWDSDLTGEPAYESLPRIYEELVPQGTLVLPAYNMGTTITAPAHTTMMTGVRQRLANFSVDEGPGLYRPDRPTLGEELRRQTQATQEESMILANADLVWPLDYSLMPGYGPEMASEWFFVAIAPGETQPAPDDSFATVALNLELQDTPRRLVMANLKEVDRKGHYGDDIADYVSSVEELDEPIMDLWESLAADPVYGDRTVMVITSDHGRHRIEDNAEFGEDFWRNHGDASAGDREVPIFMIGPGVRKGQIIEAPYTLEDLAPTLAALMDIKMPWARGVPIAEALEEVPDWTRSGVGAIAASGDFMVEELFETDDAYRRSSIWWDEQRLSNPDAFAAESPSVVATDDGALACWRELHVDNTWMPWVPHCALLSAESGVTPIDAPQEQVGPFWEPDLRVVDGLVAAAYIHNPDDIAELGQLNDVSPREARWNGEDWELGVIVEPQVFYPTDLSVADLGDDSELWAYAANPGGSGSRYTRRIYVQEVAWRSDGLEVSQVRALTPTAQEPQAFDWRQEHPVVRGDGDTLVMALHSYQDEQRQIWRVTSDDGGEVWSPAEIVVDDPDLYTNLPPDWMGDRLARVSYDGRVANVCAEDGSGSNTCIRLDTDRVSDIAWDGGLLHIVRGNPDGSWSRQTLSL